MCTALSQLREPLNISVTKTNVRLLELHLQDTIQKVLLGSPERDRAYTLYGPGSAVGAGIRR